MVILRQCSGIFCAMTHDMAPDAVKRLGDSLIEITLLAEPAAVRVARRFIESEWTDLDEDVLADTNLIVTELVANAVQHGAPEICLRLRSAPFAIDVAVLDHGTGEPRMNTVAEVANLGSGRGLAIVDRLAAAWGVDPLETGGDENWCGRQ